MVSLASFASSSKSSPPFVNSLGLQEKPTARRYPPRGNHVVLISETTRKTWKLSVFFAFQNKNNSSLFVQRISHEITK